MTAEQIKVKICYNEEYMRLLDYMSHRYEDILKMGDIHRRQGFEKLIENFIPDEIELKKGGLSF